MFFKSKNNIINSKYLTIFYTFVLMLLLGTTSAFASWSVDESFEDGEIPADWTIYDVNNDGDQWTAYENQSYAHTGNWAALVDCYTSDGDDWLITPQVSIQAGDSFSFFARAWYDVENFEVKLSTGGNAISSFTITLESVTGISSDYTKYSYDLSAYAGMSIYLGIHWMQETYGFLVDDVKVGQSVATDAGMLSIPSPEDYEEEYAEIYPSALIKNFGTDTIGDYIYVTCSICDSLDNVVYTSMGVHTSSLSPGDSVVVALPDLWNPSEIGEYSITMTVDLDGDENANNDTMTKQTEVYRHYGTGGPDSFGYVWIDSSEPNGPEYNWIEINTTGTSAIMYGVDTFYGDDNFSEPIDFGFDFSFYGIDHSYFYVDTNGEILLSDNNWYEPYPDDGWNSDGNMFNYVYPIPGNTYMPDLLAVYWDDLEADQGTGDIYFQTFGTEPDRYCVIEWYNFKFHSGDGGTSTLCFEAILHEDGEIIFQYKTVANDQSGSVAPHNYGQSSTVGIQNTSADVGLCYLEEVVNNGVYIGVEPYGNCLKNEMAIRFYTGQDTFPPVFAYEEIGNTFDNTPELSVKITDLFGVQTDTLYYNIGGGWQAISHCAFEEPNIFYYELPNIPNSHTVEYYFAARDSSDDHNRGTLPANAPTECFSFKILPTNGVEVLFAYPGNQDYQQLEYPVYIDALNNAGITYDIYNWYEYDDYRFSPDYKAIITYANSASSNAKADTFAVALMEYMDSGVSGNPKHVFLASDGIAYAQHGYPNSKPLKKFYTAYMRGGYYPTGTYGQPPYGGTNGLGGPDCFTYEEGSVIMSSNSPVTLYGDEAPVYANSPDVIYARDCPDWYADEVTNPSISSNSSFLFEDGPGPLVAGQAYCYHGVCGIWLDNLIYKSFFMSFDLSQFTEQQDINSIISTTLDWFDISYVGVSEPQDPENTIEHVAHFPNPVSTSSTFRFSVKSNSDQAGKTNLSIYNIRGQRVKTLVNDNLITGEYTIEWDCTDEYNKPVADGVYFYKLDIGDTYIETDKMIIVK